MAAEKTQGYAARDVTQGLPEGAATRGCLSVLEMLLTVILPSVSLVRFLLIFRSCVMFGTVRNVMPVQGDVFCRSLQHSLLPCSTARKQTLAKVSEADTQCYFLHVFFIFLCAKLALWFGKRLACFFPQCGKSK